MFEKKSQCFILNKHGGGGDEELKIVRDVWVAPTVQGGSSIQTGRSTASPSFAAASDLPKVKIIFSFKFNKEINKNVQLPESKFIKHSQNIFNRIKDGCMMWKPHQTTNHGLSFWNLSLNSINKKKNRLAILIVFFLKEASCWQECKQHVVFLFLN